MGYFRSLGPRTRRLAAFLERRIGFLAISQLIERALDACPGGALGSIEQCVEVDGWTRRRVREWVGLHAGGTA